MNAEDRISCEQDWLAWVDAHPVNKRWPRGATAGHRNLIVKAAKQQGLTVEKEGRKTFFRKNGALVGGLNGMMPHTTSWLAYQLCKSKQETRRALAEAALPLAKGAAFAPNELEKGRAWVGDSVDRMVIKPSGLEGGKGVIVDVTPDDLDKAWAECKAVIKAELPSREKRRKEVILVEEYVAGIEARCMVVANRLVAAATRIPAHVVGDGKRSIAELIEKKNQARHKSPYMKAKPMLADELTESYLVRSGRDLSTIPVDGEHVWLSSATNVSRGGETIDVTEMLDAPIRGLAEQAIQAIPGMDTGGVDVLFDPAVGYDSAIIVEVNACPNIGMHHYPHRGAARDVASAWVDALYLARDIQE